MKKSNGLIKVIFLLLLVTSCNNEEALTPEMESIFPKVASTQKISQSQLNQIGTIELANGRSMQSFDIESSISAVYENYEAFEFVYVPYQSKKNFYMLYTFKNGQLSKNVMEIEERDNQLIYKTALGTIKVNFDGNKVLGVSTNLSSDHPNGRTACSLNDLAKSYGDCGKAINEQLTDAVGSFGALVAEVGCSLWIVCRGAVIVTCSALAASEC